MKYPILILLQIILLSTTVQAGGIFDRCAASLRKLHGIYKSENIEARIDGTSWVEINRILVTGSPYEIVLQNLLLDETYLQQMKERKLSVLTVGEGRSELLPKFIEKGITIKALDLWYHSRNLPRTEYDNSETELMIKFQREFKTHLLRGSALEMPLPKESFDVILSHRLANNLHIAEQLKFFAESIRVLKIGGEARILLSHDRQRHFCPQCIKVILEFFEEYYREIAKIEIDEGLLIIRKTDPLPAAFEYKIPYDSNTAYEDLPRGARMIRTELDREAAEKHEKDQLYYQRRLKEVATELQEDPDNTELIEKRDFFQSMLKREIESGIFEILLHKK